MTDAPTAATPDTPPAPDPTGAAKESRSGRLLALVRKLIDYGQHLAATLRLRAVPSDTTAPAHLRHQRPRPDPRPHRPRPAARQPARGTDHPHRRPPRRRTPAQTRASPRAPRALPSDAQPPTPHAPPTQQPAETDPCLANLPTPEQIAAKVRRQPIGAVLADICRDLGIRRSHPLWDELHCAITTTAAATSAWSRTCSTRRFPPQPPHSCA